MAEKNVCVKRADLQLSNLFLYVRVGGCKSHLKRLLTAIKKNYEMIKKE
jgi:hypothetical protein